MSTPSDTMRTATIHGSLDAEKRAMRLDDMRVVRHGHRGPHAAAVAQQVGDALGVVLVGGDDSPPASGWVRRSAPSRSWACSSTVGSHSPSRLSAVRSRWAARVRSRASSNAAAWAPPSGAIHSMKPLMRGK